jgi:Tol biopolymer transport system component
VTWDPDWDSLVVSTPEGTRLAGWEWVNLETDADQWIDGTRILSYYSHRPRQLNIVSLTDGETRVVTDRELNLYGSLGGGSWSPDGRRFAATSAENEFRGLVILDVSGSIERIPTDTYGGRGLVWSPDGRSVAYQSWQGVGEDGDVTVRVLDLATRAERLLVARAAVAAPLRWTADGQGVIYGVWEPGPVNPLLSSGRPLVPREMELRVAGLDGSDRPLGQIETVCPTTGFDQRCFRYLGESAILWWDPSELYVRATGSDGMGRTLFSRDGRGSPVPTVSSNGRWIAVRLRGENDQWDVHVLAADGSSQRAVPLPAPFLASPDNAYISDDGSEVLYIAEATSGSGPVVYRVDVATGEANAVLSLPEEAGMNLNPPSHRSFSPDGEYVIFNTPGEERATLLEIDISELLGAGR